MTRVIASRQYRPKTVIFALVTVVLILFACGGGGGGGNSGDDERDRPSAAADYGFEYVNVTYRVYESGSERYQVSAGISDNGEPCNETDLIRGVVKDSSGNELSPSNEGFYYDHFIWYDCGSGRCTQAGPFEETGVWAHFGDLPADTYTAAFEMENGQNLTETVQFQGRLALPFVSSNAMASNWNGGDLELSWANPTTSPNWNAVDQLRVVVFDDLGNSVLYIRAAPTDASVTIPSAIVTQAQPLQGGTRLGRWEIQTRAYDARNRNFARAYSARADISAGSDENEDGDGDGYTRAQGDCDDDDGGVHPGATEVCGDGIDQDCDGEDAACGGGIQCCQCEWSCYFVNQHGSGTANSTATIRTSGSFSDCMSECYDVATSPTSDCVSAIDITLAQPCDE